MTKKIIYPEHVNEIIKWDETTKDLQYLFECYMSKLTGQEGYIPGTS